VDKGVVARGCKVAAAAGDDDAAAAISDVDEWVMPSCISDLVQRSGYQFPLSQRTMEVTLTNTALLKDKCRISTGQSPSKVQQKG
jgi:hypothetical protein